MRFKKYTVNIVLIIIALVIFGFAYKEAFAMKITQDLTATGAAVAVTEVTEVTEETVPIASFNTPNTSPMLTNTHPDDDNNDLWEESCEPEGEGDEELWIDDTVDYSEDTLDEDIDVVDEEVELDDGTEAEETEYKEYDPDLEDCPQHELIETEGGLLYCPYCGEIGEVGEYEDNDEE